jgi:hypothetical protein
MQRIWHSGKLVRIIHLFRMLSTYQVSVIPKPGEMTKDNLEGSRVRFLFLNVATKALAVFETTASPPLFMCVIEERSKVPKTSVLFSKSWVSLTRRKLGAKVTLIDFTSIKRRKCRGSDKMTDACTWSVFLDISSWTCWPKTAMVRQ